MHRACIKLHPLSIWEFYGRFWVHASLPRNASTDEEQPMTRNLQHVRFFGTVHFDKTRALFHCALCAVSSANDLVQLLNTSNMVSDRHAACCRRK